MAKKSGLGMGLGALFDDNSSVSSENTTTLRISQIEPNRSQPRRYFDDEKLKALADSIGQSGLLVPIIVRADGDGRYKIIAGERRFRACKMLGHAEIPAIVKDFSDKDAVTAALIENIVREDLNPVEEARGMRELMDEYHLTQEVLSKTIGRSRSAIANAVRLLSLPGEVLAMLESGSLTAGQGKVLAGITSENTLLELAGQAADGGMTVRELERAADIAAKADENREAPPRKLPARNNYFTETALGLSEMLDRKISVTPLKKDGTGRLSIEFDSEEDLKQIVKLLEKLAD